MIVFDTILKEKLHLIIYVHAMMNLGYNRGGVTIALGLNISRSTVEVFDDFWFFFFLIVNRF